jgi:hypothetical protein
LLPRPLGTNCVHRATQGLSPDQMPAVTSRLVLPHNELIHILNDRLGWLRQVFIM